jgi:hypothetical protein
MTDTIDLGKPAISLEHTARHSQSPLQKKRGLRARTRLHSRQRGIGQRCVRLKPNRKIIEPGGTVFDPERLEAAVQPRHDQEAND